MNHQHRLLRRLDEIAQSLQQTGQALALIGLGSVGLETDRLDAYSDLDFFVIARDGQRDDFLNDLAWLARPCPIAYAFRNTVDGYKALYQDGIFVEFAVFERRALEQSAYAPGRLVWAAEGVDPGIAIPPPTAPPQPPLTDWLLGEAVTNLYVGLGRYHRGEKLSAMRFVQGYAVDRILELAARIQPAQSAGDPFSPERRFERRFPGLAALLPEWMQGYDRTPQSALAILRFLDAHFAVNAAMKDAILRLAESGAA